MSFRDTYRDIICRLARFRTKSDFETVKTVGIIDALIERASTIDEGALPDMPLGTVPGHTIENFAGRAERYLSALERGEYPLKGMFTEPGKALVDHSFVQKDGKLHIFYNIGAIGYEWSERYVDSFGHAWTEDLVNWHIEPRVLYTEPNGIECYQIWSPGVVQKGDTYYMYYTGVNYNVAQCQCLATSKDLYNWEKYGNNPVLLPGPWNDWSADKWSDCRDAFVFMEDDGNAYMYYCTAVSGNGVYNAAVGMAKSDDMIHWEDLGFKEFGKDIHALESPFVMKKDGLYYLFYTKVGHGSAYAVSDAPFGDWEDKGMIIPTDGRYDWISHVPSCSEVFEFKGEWYISCAWRHPGCEQYLEIFKLTFNSDGSVTLGERIS